MSPDDTASKACANAETGAERQSLEVNKINLGCDRLVRYGIFRLVKVLEDAGEPLPIRVVVRRMQEDGSIPEWAFVYMTALEEGAVWRTDDGMLYLPQKREPGTSPEAQAMHTAFGKAHHAGVMRKMDERYVFTRFPPNGKLTPSEIEGAERWVNRHNAMAQPEVRNMYALCRMGKITREELRAYIRDVAAQADAQPLVYAPQAALKKEDTASPDALQDDIARLVEISKEAGEPLGTTEADAASKRMSVYMRALTDNIVWTPETGMMWLSPKTGPWISPEELARHDAFDKAKRLGVMRRASRGLMFTNRQDDGLLTPAELEMAERMMNRQNALEQPEVSGMQVLYLQDMMSKEELEAFMSDVIARAEAQPLMNAQARERRLVKRGAAPGRHHAPPRWQAAP